MKIIHEFPKKSLNIKKIFYEWKNREREREKMRARERVEIFLFRMRYENLLRLVQLSRKHRAVNKWNWVTFADDDRSAIILSEI